MPVDPTTAGTSISLSGDAGCLGCLAIVGLPTVFVWRTKRRLFGMGQPPVEHVWRAHAHVVRIGPPSSGAPPPPLEPQAVPGLEQVSGADDSFSVAGFQAGVIAAFAELVHPSPGGDAYIAVPAVLGAIRRRPRHAVMQRGRLLSASSGGGEDVITADVSGVRTFGVIWWRAWEERWTFSRVTPVHGGGSPVCRVCGAPAQNSADGRCPYCQNPAPGPIDTWRLSRREPLVRALFG